MTSTLILVVLGIGVVLFFTWAAFRQAVRIRAGKAVSGATTPLERNKDRLKQLSAQLPGQRRAVANCMATVDDIRGELTKAEGELGGLQAEYKTAKGTSGNDAALDAIGRDYEKTEQRIAGIKARLTEAQGASNEAQRALDQTITSLDEFADKIEDSELKTHLREALETAAAAKQQASDINSKLSEANEDFAAVDHDLNVARNMNKLGDGTQGDQQRAEIKRQAAAQSGRSKLDALTGGDTKTTEQPKQ